MLYFAYIRLSFRTQLQYRMSFWFTASAQLATAFFGFLSMYLLFERFGSIAGWSLGEAALCRGVTVCAFALAECVARGFDGFHRFMLHGDFDRLLLRPRGLVLQVLGSQFELSRIGRFVQAICTLLYAAQLLELQWTALRFFTFVVPFTCFNYLPLLFVTGRAQGQLWLYLLSPLGRPLFLLPCVWIFYRGVRYYIGSGS